ncbi:tripartite tricarboxylate transporter substrate binding protein [Enterovirga sp.]|uniref:Bug family tripartite tricarboxylate transporter substrate binding protein n=1 Tax=Enterovirga sp. TaxID=2026350 RepID=UPI00262E9B4D|nr:tripartite tricarboxylate transporter substrate binding protein [Enterovirga sp.]MDB5592443.1 transporter substrate-binding protein [Enterovirga sp.]
MLRRTLLSLAAAAALLPGAMAQAETYPARPIRFTVPFPAGSATDSLARYMGEKLSTELKQPVIIENKPGANGIVAVKDFVRLPPDGYNVFIGSNTTHAANLSLYRALPYDPAGDFTPVSCLMRIPLVLVVRPTLPVNSVAELVALAKQKPGDLTFGASSSSARAGAELFKMRTGTNLRHVPYKGAPQIINDLLGGHVDTFVADATTAMGQVSSGALRALAVTTAQRVESFPGVPTMMEAGVPDYELIGWFAAFLPAGAPPELVQTLNRAFTSAIAAPGAKEFFGKVGGIPHACAPQELAAFRASETEKWRDVVETAGIEKQ